MASSSIDSSTTDTVVYYDILVVAVTKATTKRVSYSKVAEQFVKSANILLQWIQKNAGITTVFATSLALNLLSALNHLGNTDILEEKRCGGHTTL